MTARRALAALIAAEAAGDNMVESKNEGRTMMHGDGFKGSKFPGNDFDPPFFQREHKSASCEAHQSSTMTTSSSADLKSRPSMQRPYALPVSIGALAVVIGTFLHGIHNTSSLNGIFPIVIEGIQHMGSALLGKTPTDESMFEYGADGLPLCRECHCTPEWEEDPEQFVCPEEPPPTWQYSTEDIETLRSHVATNPIQLDCNPYEDEGCDTTPPLGKGGWGDDAVCGLIYDVPSDNMVSGSSCSLTNYTIQSFQSAEEAASVNAVVTHLGHCGVCSTTQDLAAYMSHPDMVAEGRKCTNRALLSANWGRQCYAALGFTTPCATIWAQNSINTATVCRATCVRHLFTPANLPEPSCKLNDCLHCDEIKSGPNFQLLAGRTRRNSGLRTPIMRQCAGFAFLEHEACPMNVVLGKSGEKNNDDGEKQEEE